MNNSTKVLWISDAPNIPTGFGNVARFILKYFPQNEFDINILGVNYFGDPHDLPYKIFPAALRGEVYGIQRLKELCENIHPQIIFILNDAWVIDQYLQSLKQIYKPESMPKIIVYFPVDAKDHDPTWYKNFDVVSKIITYTNFAKEVVLAANPELEIEIIPHGVDTETFFKIENKQELKKTLYKNNPELHDSFIVLSAQRNQPRKRLDLTMKAFKVFSADKPENVKLYMHCGIQDVHMDIIKLASRLGIENRLIVSNLATGIQRVPFERLNYIYNVTDIGINTSTGEGWNLPCMEHAITGAPQVLPNHSALAEIYKDIGLLVPAKEEFILDNIMTTGYLARIEDLAEGMDTLYHDPGIYKAISETGVRKFSKSKYNWKTISEQWAQIFRSML